MNSLIQEPFKAHINERLGDSLRPLSKVLSVFFFNQSQGNKGRIEGFSSGLSFSCAKITSELLDSLGYDPFFAAPTSFNVNREIQDI